jgi:hypothetical protein
MVPQPAAKHSNSVFSNPITPGAQQAAHLPPTKVMSHIRNFNFDTGTFFAAHTSAGGIRVGMNNLCAIEFPKGHAMFDEANALTPETVEAFIDAQVEAGSIDIRTFA